MAVGPVSLHATKADDQLPLLALLLLDQLPVQLHPRLPKKPD